MARRMETVTIYRMDVHLKGGTIMEGVTVRDFSVSPTSVSWHSGGDSPLTWIERDQIAGVVVREEFTTRVEVEEEED